MTFPISWRVSCKPHQPAPSGLWDVPHWVLWTYTHVVHFFHYVFRWSQTWSLLRGGGSLVPHGLHPAVHPLEGFGKMGCQWKLMTEICWGVHFSIQRSKRHLPSMDFEKASVQSLQQSTNPKGSAYLMPPQRSEAHGAAPLCPLCWGGGWMGPLAATSAHCCAWLSAHQL